MFWKKAMKIFNILLAATTVGGTVSAALPCHSEEVLRTNVDPVAVFLDGKELDGGWNLMIGEEVDPIETTAREIVFASDTDTLRISLNEWESKDFTIITASGKRAPVRATRISDNIYENPDPRLLNRGPGGLLSREQAGFDIRALVYALTEVHPDIFSTCTQEDFFRAVNKAVDTLPDSVSVLELYRRAAPVVAMIGDGHTNLAFPFNEVFTPELKRMPFWVDVLSDKSIRCRASLDSIIPAGAKILSINGNSAETIVDSMLPFVAGEREPFRLARVDSFFPGLRHLLYPSGEFEVVYQSEGSHDPQKTTFPALPYDEVLRRSPSLDSPNDKQPYSYSIDRDRKTAIMDFRQFSNPAKMEIFADSMFRQLRNEDIDNLVIDLRHNGGGNSLVGDILLRYISPEPFIQMDKALIRVSPFTRKLMSHRDISPMFTFYEIPREQFIKPLSEEEGHYSGDVYLLTSNHTFSSAGSFAWAFKECKTGKVIGEETGGMNVCFGDILQYRLPVSGLKCSISFKRFWQLRANENDIHGTLPDVAVPASAALDRALEIIDSKKSK